jgi:hypothetical protein
MIGRTWRAQTSLKIELSGLAQVGGRMLTPSWSRRALQPDQSEMKHGAIIPVSRWKSLE